MAVSEDVTFALRQLRSTPGFTLVAVLTLALGIGANSAIFALVDATLLRPLAVRQPDRLVMVWERTDRTPRGRVAPLNLMDWTERSRTFEQIAGFIPGVGGMVMAGVDGTAETVSRQWVSSGFFRVLGVEAIAGRTFVPTDDSQNARAVVMSEALWRTRFEADPTIVGRDLRLDGELYTVVGIVPRDFQLTGRTSIWALIPLSDRRPPMRTAYVFHAVGRMKPGIAIDAASADMTAVADGLARELPDTNHDRSVLLEPLSAVLVGRDLRVTSILFLGVVGFVLLICCANVANLLLARGTVRVRELAVRSALGADRGRIVRQLLTESLVLSVIGGVPGMAIGAWILTAAPALIPQGLLPPAVTLSFDARIIAFGAAAALFVGVLFGLAPAWQSTHVSTSQVLSSESRGSTGRSGSTRSVLVAAEIATAVVLMFGAGLLLRTLVAVETLDRGYRADRVLSMLVDPLGSRYPTAESLRQFFDAVEQEVKAIPGVQDVAWSSQLPLGQEESARRAFEVEGTPPVDERQRPVADYQIVSASYFKTLDVSMVAGRGFQSGDTRDAVAVCIVNEAFVRSHLQGRSPIGLRLTLRSPTNPQAPAIVREIVGVARQVKGQPDETEDVVQIYVPMAQSPTDDIYLLVRPASGRADALAPSVRAAIGRIDKEQLVSVRDVLTLEEVAQEATARHRFRATMVVTFAGLALLLAMVGVFGVLTYSVQQRGRDLAVRRALGATSADVLRLIVSSIVPVIAAGALVGLVLSSVLSRFLATLLFGVQPLDPITFAAVTFVVALTAAVATAAPIWRALRIDPAVTLRSQ